VERSEYIEKYLAELKGLLTEMEGHIIEEFNKIADILYVARSNGNTIFIMGNGGSAATATHFVGDLSKGTIVEGHPRFKAIGLTDNIPNMLAWANDASYEDIFVEQLVNLMDEGDVVIGISGSGNSPNVVKAMEFANNNGGITIGITGYSPENKMMKTAKHNIHIPSYNMQQCEDIHIILEHMLTSMIREEQKDGTGTA